VNVVEPNCTTRNRRKKMTPMNLRGPADGEQHLGGLGAWHREPDGDARHQ
jgi:hypothetical protein